jgi:hypothetical protein
VTLPPDGRSWRRWYAHRAQFLTQFGRDLRSGLRERGLGRVKVSIWVRPNHCLFDGIDLGAWLNEGLCDAVVTGPVIGADEKSAPELYEPSPAWVQKVRGHVPLHRCVFWEGSYATAMSQAKRRISQGYDGLCLYESNQAVLDSAVIRVCQELRK